MLLLLLVFSLPLSPGHTTRELYFIAWSTPRIVVAAAGVLGCAAALLEVVARAVKPRWADDLRGWIH